MFSDALQETAARCSPYVCAPPWKFLDADSGALRAPAQPRRWSQTLCKPFTPEQRNAAGFTRLKQIDLQLRPPRPNSLLLALRDDRGAVFDFVREAGCLLNSRAPLVTALSYPWGALRNSDTLLVTGDLEDAILLQSLGFAAIPAVGIAEFGPNEEGWFRRAFGSRGPESDGELDTLDRSATPEDSAPSTSLASPQSELAVPSDEHFPKHLVLVRWTVRTLNLDEPEPIRRAVNRLRELQRFRGWDLDAVLTWRPASHDLRKLQFALANSDQNWVRDAISNSLDFDALPLTFEEPDAKASPVSLAGILQELEEVACREELGFADRDRRADLLREYAQVGHSMLVQPFLAASEHAANPSEQIQLVQGAQLMQLLLDRYPHARRGLQLAPLAQGAPRLISELLSLYKCLHPYLELLTRRKLRRVGR